MCFSRPGNTYKLGELAPGEQVTLLEEPEVFDGAEWYRVRNKTGSVEGWVPDSYLTIIAP